MKYMHIAKIVNEKICLWFVFTRIASKPAIFMTSLCLAKHTSFPVKCMTFLVYCYSNYPECSERRAIGKIYII